MSLTVAEVREKLGKMVSEDYNDVLEAFLNEDAGDDLQKAWQEAFGEKFDLLAASGQTDYDGGYAWVFKIGDQLFMLDGWYDSYEGADCDDWNAFYECEPYRYTVTRYRKKAE